jgi:DNA modification methylase
MKITENIELYKVNCLELMKSIPDGSIDAIICDPPYGTTACKWDSVIDFTMGSGSTGVACVNTNRKFIGIEQDSKYFEIACKRLNKVIV